MKHVLALAAALAALPAVPQAQAQQPATPATRPAPAPDPKMLAAQQAFEALPEAERRAIQQDLGFATAFNGAALGSFGSLTFNGIQSFEREQKLAVDGILTPDERKALAAAAQNARRALRFALIDDDKSKARIGVPQNVFVKREANAQGGSRWQTSDGKATLDTLVAAKEETLQTLFDKATAATPNRKVTYKLLRPDFLVVTAETAGGKSYRRMSLGPDGAIRGFAIGYDKALAPDMDRLTISVANSFEAFPGAVPAVAAASSTAPPRPPTQTAPPLPAAPRERLASGLLLDGGAILAAETGVKDCRTLAAGPRKSAARVVTTDSTSGLALLRADGLPRASAFTLVAAGPAGATLVAIGQAWSGAQPTAVFAEAMPAGAGRIAAPLQPGGSGAALFDAEGRLAGLVTDDPGARRQIAGVAPQARYRFAGSEAIAAFLQKAGAALPKGDPAKAAGGVAALRREAVVTVVCGL